MSWMMALLTDLMGRNVLLWRYSLATAQTALIPIMLAYFQSRMMMMMTLYYPLCMLILYGVLKSYLIAATSNRFL